MSSPSSFADGIVIVAVIVVIVIDVALLPVCAARALVEGETLRMARRKTITLRHVEDKTEERKDEGREEDEEGEEEEDE